MAKLTIHELHSRVLRKRDDYIHHLEAENIAQFEELVVLRDAARDHKALMDIYQAKIDRLEKLIPANNCLQQCK